MMKKLLIGIVLILLALGIFFVVNKNKGTNSVIPQEGINTGSVIVTQTGAIDLNSGAVISGADQQNTGTQGEQTGNIVPANGDDTVLPLDPENGGAPQNPSGAITADPEVDEIVNLLEELIAESEGN